MIFKNLTGQGFFPFINVRTTMASFLLPIICCSIVPTKNTERDAAIKKLLKRNGAGPGHQLSPQEIPGAEVVTISPNNGKYK